MPLESVHVDGLKEVQQHLRKLDGDIAKQLKAGLNDAIRVVADDAKRRVPTRSGRLKRSIRLASTQTAAVISAGGPRVPYYGFIEFGGSVGKGRKSRAQVTVFRTRTGKTRVRSRNLGAKGTGSVVRTFIKGGRYVWPALAKHKQQVTEAVHLAVLDAVKAAGLEVSTRG